MKDIIIGLGICISLYSTFYYLQCKNKKENSKNDKVEKVELNNKEEINNEEEIKKDESTQTENLIKNIDGKIETVKDVLDDIVTTVEKDNQDKKPTVSFDEDFEVIQ